MKLKDFRKVLTPVFFADRKSNFTIEGFNIDGNRDNQNASGTQDGGLHGISCYACVDYYIVANNIVNSYTDGIYIRGYGTNAEEYISPVNTNIIDNYVDNSRRQGLSVISCKRMKVKDNYFINTQGTAPQAGIDIEPNNSYEVVEDIIIEGCTIVGNKGRAIALHVKSTCKNLTITNCTMDSNSVLETIAFTGGGIFENIVIKNNKNIGNISINSVEAITGLGIYDNTYIGNIVLRNSENINIARNSVRAITVITGCSNLKVEKNVFEKIEIESTQSTTACILLGIGSATTTSTNVVINDNVFKENKIRQIIYITNAVNDVEVKNNYFLNNNRETSNSIIRFQNTNSKTRIYNNKFDGNSNIYNISSVSKNISIQNNTYKNNTSKYTGNIDGNNNIIELQDGGEKIYSCSGVMPDVSELNYEIGEVIINRNPINGIWKWVCVKGGLNSTWLAVHIDGKNTETKDIAFSPDYSQNQAFGEASLVKKGSEVFYKMFANKSTNVEVGDTVFTLQPELRPKTPEFIVGHGGNGAMVVWLMIEPETGDVKVQEFPTEGSVTTMNAIVMSGSFFIRE